jgi:hypothetical protein
VLPWCPPKFAAAMCAPCDCESYQAAPSFKPRCDTTRSGGSIKLLQTSASRTGGREIRPAFDFSAAEPSLLPSRFAFCGMNCCVFAERYPALGVTFRLNSL